MFHAFVEHGAGGRERDYGIPQVTELKHVIIYTDGACIGNPGHGGYGTVLMHGGKRRELSGGFRLTTNNRMELLAVISGLRLLRFRCDVTVYRDSQYVVRGITEGWAERWKRRGWMKNKYEPAINADLWAELLTLCADHDVRFEWVRGHAGNIENERCDELSVKAATGDLAEDIGYVGKKERAAAAAHAQFAAELLEDTT
jgi:ribonuclease HI